jgi:hypothetical protein
VIGKRRKSSADAKGHRWRDAQGFMDAAEVVVRDVQRDRCPVVRSFFNLIAYLSLRKKRPRAVTRSDPRSTRCNTLNLPLVALLPRRHRLSSPPGTYWPGGL